MTEIGKAPEFYGVWSDASEASPEWFSTKSEAVDVAKNIVADNPTVKVHLYKAVSVGTLSLTPLATGEMQEPNPYPLTASAGTV